MRSFLFACFFLLFSRLAVAEVVVDLSSGWKFKKSGESEWLPATVPGSVHLDLLKNQRIPDPFVADNEKSLQWIDTCTWEYRCEFDVSSKLLRNNHIELVFDGLDTYAEVRLNGSLILKSDNMFRNYSVSVMQLMKPKGNVMLISFAPAMKAALELEKKNRLKLPGGERVFARKAAFQWGWDFGPRFLGCGIWKPVKLRGWQSATIKDLQVYQLAVSDQSATVVIATTIESDQVRQLELDNTVTPSLEHNILTANLKIGENVIYDTLHIRNPTRWWTNELGEPFCYAASTALRSAGKTIDNKSRTFGLRELELVQEKDSSGTSFYFKLNGVPVFMKGANIVPPDHFVSRIDSSSVSSLLNEAQQSHFNMVRIWGGGVYPDDVFFDECDRRGILVWQDFMFACSMIPGDSAFVAGFREEAVQQIRRIRNHPSLALWCGNNESDEGWHNWGWQKELNYTVDDSVRVWQDYSNVFQVMLPDAVKTNDPGRNYWPSSPSIGWGHKESLLSGDAHYWGVWWGMEPFQAYTEKVGRFMTEYGFQGLPSMKSIREFTLKESMDTTRPALKNHQKHPTGFQTIQTYMDRSFNHPKDFTGYVYVTQLLQAEGIAGAIEAHRRAMPYCMGTLYWQFNDTWPGVSWSSRDYYGRRKALQYAVQSSYSRLLISPVVKPNRKVDVYVVTDSMDDYLARMELRVIDFRGNIRWTEIVAADIKANSSSLVCTRDFSRIVQGPDTAFCLLNVRILHEDRVLAESNTYFCLPKNFRLSRPAFTVRPEKDENGHIGFVLKASTFVKGIEFSFDGNTSVFTKNYFDMVPGQNYSIGIFTPGFTQEDVNRIQFRSLIDTY